MAVNINVPSQVKTYANLAAFPATGALKTIYIAEDTNKTYRWTGSVYTEISASAAMTWGAIGGTLSNQTDLQNALDAKVPTYRTLTINGVTQDLSANRTFTISTGLTIGSTAIASGTVGRILFEGAGNVVQQSSSLFWDATNNRLGIGTSSPTTIVDIQPPIGGPVLRVARTSGAAVQISASILSTGGFVGTYTASPFILVSNSAEAMRLFTTGNIGINTATDAGFRLDVNGNTRISGDITVNRVVSSIFRDGNNNTYINNSLINIATTNLALGGTTVAEFTFTTKTSGGKYVFNNANVLINTTTDDGFKLDVNGTARVSGNFTLRNVTDELLFANATVKIRRVSDKLSLEGFAGFDFIDTNTAFTRMQIRSTGNVLINTTTDAGFRLDVNGTARVATNLTVSTAGNGNMNTFLGGSVAIGSDWVNDGYILKIKANNTGVAGIYSRAGGASGYPILFCQDANGTTSTTFIVRENGNVIIGATTNIASSKLTIESTTQGFLPPRMTTTQKNAIASPAAGLMVYDTTLNVISYYNGTMWI